MFITATEINEHSHTLTSRKVLNSDTIFLNFKQKKNHIYHLFSLCACMCVCALFPAEKHFNITDLKWYMRGYISALILTYFSIWGSNSGSHARQTGTLPPFHSSRFLEPTPKPRQTLNLFSCPSLPRNQEHRPAAPVPTSAHAFSTSTSSITF